MYILFDKFRKTNPVEIFETIDIDVYKCILFNNFELLNMEIGQEMKFAGLVLLFNQIELIIVFYASAMMHFHF